MANLGSNFLNLSRKFFGVFAIFWQSGLAQAFVAVSLLCSLAFLFEG